MNNGWKVQSWKQNRTNISIPVCEAYGSSYYFNHNFLTLTLIEEIQLTSMATTFVFCIFPNSICKMVKITF